MSWKSAETWSTIGLRVQPGRARRLLDLLAVLVGAGQEENLVAVQPLEARHDVGRDRGVGVADMRRAVHVVDRRGDVEALGHARVIADAARSGQRAARGHRLAVFYLSPREKRACPRTRPFIPSAPPSPTAPTLQGLASRRALTSPSGRGRREAAVEGAQNTHNANRADPHGIPQGTIRARPSALSATPLPPLASGTILGVHGIVARSSHSGLSGQRSNRDHDTHRAHVARAVCAKRTMPTAPPLRPPPVAPVNDPSPAARSSANRSGRTLQARHPRVAWHCCADCCCLRRIPGTAGDPACSRNRASRSTPPAKSKSTAD